MEGSSAMWLLVQHQDKDINFQKECLKRLKKAVEAHESPAQNYAYLIDRVRMNEKLPQIYRTQLVQIEEKFVLYSVEDLAALDERREKAELCSIDEYKETIKEMYQLTDEDFK